MLISLIVMQGFALSACVNSSGLVTHERMAGPAAYPVSRSLAETGGGFASTWPATGWWLALGDTQLDQLIREALRDNPDLAAAEARVRQASALAMNADSQRAPKLNAQASVQDIHLPAKLLSSTASEEDLTPKILGLNGSYSVDLWGGERATWEAAVDRQHAAEIDAQAARITLSVNVARVYAQLGYACQLHDLMQKDAARARHLLDLTAQRVAAGIDGTALQNQADALYATARQRLAQAAHGVESQRAALAILLGKGPDRAAEIAKPAILQPAVLAIPENLSADLLGRRPDIVASRWRVEAAQRDVESAKAAFYPNFNLTAAIGLVSLHSSDLISLRSRYYSVAPAISLPIFDGGRLRANLAGRDADYDFAVAQYNRTLASAINEVLLQVQAGVSLATQKTAQQQAADAAREGWNLSMQRYQRGIGSYIDVLTAEQSLLAAETTLVDIQTQQIDAGIQLIYALGGGYRDNTEADPVPPATMTSKVSS